MVTTTDAPNDTQRGSAGATTRVVMFVRNDCTTDVRVLREAASLHASGRDVTIIALQPSGRKALPEHETRDGIEIVRVPTPTGWSQRWWTIRHGLAVDAIVGALDGGRPLSAAR